MKVKAYKIISELFYFFMKHEHMLPSIYKHRIEFDAQRLFVANYEGDSNDDINDRLVIRYLYERLEEMNNQVSDKLEVSNLPPKNNATKIIDFYFSKKNKFKNELWNNNDDNDDIKKLLEDLKMEVGDSIEDRKIEFFALCKHIAKARVIADYIATMTDRYAEKKYNEIKSSNTAWSTSFYA